MTPFDWVEPRSLAEAVALLEEPSVRPISGGTAVMLMLKTGIFRPTRLVSLQEIEAQFSEIELDRSGVLRIGAMASLADLEHSANVAARFPVLTETLRTLSNVRVRNVARVGGALAHGDPHMDLPPVLSALGARVRIASADGYRDLAVNELYAGYYETVLRYNELIADVTIPPLGTKSVAYTKCTSRSADDWPALGIAVAFDVAADNVMQNVQLFVSAAVNKLTRLHSTESLLEGAVVNDSVLQRAGESAAEEASPLGDAHGSGGYKKELLRIYLGRTVRRALSVDSQQHK